MENSNFAVGYDEFGCFHISDFSVGDAILVQTEDGRVRGLVTGVSQKSTLISYRSRSGEKTCHLNDVVFLSESERGWLSNA